MKRCVRQIFLGGALLLSSNAMAIQGHEELQSKIVGLKTKALARAHQQQVLAEQAASEPGFLAQRAPWLDEMLNSWKSYLSQSPQVDYLPVQSGEEASVRFAHTWSSHSYDHVGSKQTPATVGFGAARFPLRDAFAASNLLINEHVHAVKQVDEPAELTNNSQHYLALLGNQTIGFDSHVSRQEMSVNVVRRFMDDRLAVDVTIPVVRQAHRLSLSKEATITRSNRTALVDIASINSQLVRGAVGVRSAAVEAPPFYQQYNDMGDFLHQVLEGGGIAIKKAQEEVGLGDIRVAATYQLPVSYVDECVVGGSVQLATAQRRRNVALWEPELGNEATRLNVHAKCALHRGVYANPFISAQMSYNLPVKTSRRVPYRLSHDGASHLGERMVQAMPRTIFFSDTMNLGGSSFNNQPETHIRDFASTIRKISLHKGFEMNLQIGNRMERCFNQPLFVSVAWNLHLGQKHSVGGIDSSKFATEVLTHNTFTFASTLSGGIGYHINDNCRAQAGCSYRFAGRNVQADICCDAQLAFRF